MPIKELVADCVGKMKGPFWAYLLHPRSVELDLEDFLQGEKNKKMLPLEEKTELEELNRRYAYRETLPGLLKEYFPRYLKKLYCAEEIDPEVGKINLKDAQGLFEDFGVEFIPSNVDQFLATLSAEFSNIPDGEILNLLQSN